MYRCVTHRAGMWLQGTATSGLGTSTGWSVFCPFRDLPRVCHVGHRRYRWLFPRAGVKPSFTPDIYVRGKLWISFTKMPSSLLLCSVQKLGFIPPVPARRHPQGWSSPGPRCNSVPARGSAWVERRSLAGERKPVQELKNTVLRKENQRDLFCRGIFASLVPSLAFCLGLSFHIPIPPCLQPCSLCIVSGANHTSSVARSSSYDLKNQNTCKQVNPGENRDNVTQLPASQLM